MKQIKLLNIFLLSSLLMLLCNCLHAQIQTGEFPPSFYEKTTVYQLSSKANLTEILAKPDIKTLQAEDAIEDQYKDIPWRFGKAIAVDFDLQTNGNWENNGFGESIWKLKIEAKDAISLNLNFSTFHLSKNAKLFLYNENYSDVLGALTHRNNKVDSLFATRPMKGAKLMLELHVPTIEKSQNKIHINQVVYGYRSIFDKADKSFGISASCNQNISCTEGERWQDVKRSIVLILRSNNTRWCSGALVNNTLQDGTPYILTAAHCNLQTNSVFIFNYESPNCSPNQDGILSNSITGAILRANNAASDFTLFQLSSTPPLSYNVYYAGWSNEEKASQFSTAIHHPRGDVKKISFDYDSVTSSNEYNTAFDHWQVGNWELGTTQIGSSGSPLFNEKQKIVGQLHGGDAACGNTLSDFYGKFSYSWNKYAGSSNQLQPWLDPNNSSTVELSGFDPQPATFSIDLELIHLYGIQAYTCDTSVQAKFTFKNKGNTPLNFIRIGVKLNGQKQSPFIWNGNLNRNEVIRATLPSYIYQNGTNELQLYVDSLSGGNDQFTANDTLDHSFFMNKSNIEVNLLLKTDNYGSETSWEIKPNNNNLISIKSPSYVDISGGRQYNSSICLTDSCFRLVLKDSWGDGFNGGGPNGNGYLLLTDLNGDTILFENNFVSASKNYSFCLNNLTSISENKKDYSKNQFSLFPNPISKESSLFLKVNQQNVWEEVLFFDLEGRIVQRLNVKSTLDISKLSKGLYIVQLKSSKQFSETKKLIITN